MASSKGSSASSTFGKSHDPPVLVRSTLGGGASALMERPPSSVFRSGTMALG